MEFVVIVVIMGVVVAFAVPRFTRVANDVRASEVVALSAALRRAAALAHEQYVASRGSLAGRRGGGNHIRGIPYISAADMPLNIKRV